MSEPRLERRDSADDLSSARSRHIDFRTQNRNNGPLAPNHSRQVCHPPIRLRTQENTYNFYSNGIDTRHCTYGQAVDVFRPLKVEALLAEDIHVGASLGLVCEVCAVLHPHVMSTLDTRKACGTGERTMDSSVLRRVNHTWSLLVPPDESCIARALRKCSAASWWAPIFRPGTTAWSGISL